MELQELIARGRFTFAGAPERLRVFEVVNGESSAKTIAKATKWRVTNTLRDLQALKDLELISLKRDGRGNPVKKDGSVVYEKTALARQIPLRYFKGVPVSAGPSRVKVLKAISQKAKRPKPLVTPSETEILDICKGGEDEVTEFKAGGTDSRKIAKEIAAFLHTRVWRTRNEGTNRADSA